MRRGNRRIRKALAAKRRWLVAEHLTRAGDVAGPKLMEVLIRAHSIVSATSVRNSCALLPNRLRQTTAN
jgi:predicted ATP-dependent serine protease